LWRAKLLTPLALVFTAVFLVAWIGVFVLPFCEVYFLYQTEWLLALIALVGWVLSLLLTRWKRFKIDSKDILNEHENI